jgi:ATP-dependent Clp protease adaptor protein ClpS
MAIEKLKMAAREAQPRVINMRILQVGTAGGMLPRLGSSPAGDAMVVSQSATPLRERQRVRQPYPHYRVIVLDDDINTFQHVVDSLVRHIPGMLPDRAWELAHRIDSDGSAVVWSGPQEQAELYHQLLGAEGLTMAPLERA